MTWTVDTLLVHLERQINDLRIVLDERHAAQTRATDAALLAQQAAVSAALAAAEKAVTKAEAAAEKRFDSVNEFRAAYRDILGEQMPRAEAEQRIEALGEKIAELRRGDSQQAGHRAGLSDGWKIAVAAVGMVATLATILSVVLALRPH